jgi:hypothetical protein
MLRQSKSIISVIPAKAGIQRLRTVNNNGTGFLLSQE